MNAAKRELLARIAYLYYIKKYSQKQISQELGIYRTTVSRFLQQAQRENIVSVQINGFDTSTFELEVELKRLGHLKNVLIAESGTQDHNLLAAKAAQYLRQIIFPEATVGFAWGNTLAGMVGQLHNFKKTNALFVPLVGGPSVTNSGYHVNGIIYDFARQLGGESLYIDKPVIQTSRYDCAQFVSSPRFEPIRRSWNNLDIAFVGIGGPLTGYSSRWRNLLTAKDITFLKERKAIGDCCCTFFDKDGKILRGETLERTIGIPLQTLQKTKTVVGVARSLTKVPSIAALLKLNVLDVLITDKETGLKLLTVLREQKS
ncbi:sugar-binding transcriptional regulator [Liquorilactobacillus aquaticus]|nr:sugar-binding domain-containing protein [Liquorilactobacillus aquaticus]